MNSQTSKPVFKVVVVGDSCTGKTSFIKRACFGFFSSTYRATVFGTDFSVKAMKVGEQELLLQLWDIAGQDRFRGATHVFYRNSAAAILMCDWESRGSLEAIRAWKSDLDSKIVQPDGTPLPCFLLVNKRDLRAEDGIADADIDRLCQELGISSWASVSAKTGQGITESLSVIGERLLNPPPPKPAASHATAAACTTDDKPIALIGLRMLKDMIPRSRCGC